MAIVRRSYSPYFDIARKFHGLCVYGYVFKRIVKRNVWKSRLVRRTRKSRINVSVGFFRRSHGKIARLFKDDFSVCNLSDVFALHDGPDEFFVKFDAFCGISDYGGKFYRIIGNHGFFKISAVYGYFVARSRRRGNGINARRAKNQCGEHSDYFFVHIFLLINMRPE